MTQPRPTTRVARGATYLFIQGFASSAISLVYFVILTRMLSNEEMGVYALLNFSLNLVLVFGTFALSSASVKYIAQYLAKEESERARSVVTRILQVFLLTSLVAFGFLFLPAELLSRFMFGSLDYAFLFRLLAFCAIFTVLHTFMLGCLQGLQKIREVALISLVYALSQSFSGIFLLLAGLRLLAIVLSWLVGVVVSSSSGLILTSKYLGLRGKLHPLRPLINFSYPLYVSSIVVFFAAWVDQLLIVSYMSAVLGSTEAQRLLGIYYVAVRASAIPTLLSAAMVTALFPQLSELYTQQGIDRLRDAFHVSTRYLALVGFPVIFGLATLSGPVVLIFAGQRYVEAALPLTIICFAALPVTLGVSINPILLTLERTKTVSVITVLSIFFNIVVSYIALVNLPLGNSLPGPALARTLSSILTFGLSIYALKRIFSINFDVEALWKASVSSLSMMLALLFLDGIRQLFMGTHRHLFDIDFYLLIFYVGVGATTYFLSLVALKTIKKHDIEMFRDYLPKGFKWVATWLSRLARLD